MKFNETKSQERLINLMLQAGVEWPEGFNFAAQGHQREVMFYKEKPIYKFGCGVWSSKSSNGDFGVIVSERVGNYHTTRITREQYEARDGWITWHGGERPVDGDLIVTVTGNDEIEITGFAKEFYWNGPHITSFRIHKEQPASEPCESVKACTHDQPTIEQLIVDYVRCRADAQHAQSMAEATSLKADMAADAVRKALADAGWQQ